MPWPPDVQSAAGPDGEDRGRESTHVFAVEHVAAIADLDADVVVGGAAMPGNEEAQRLLHRPTRTAASRGVSVNVWPAARSTCSSSAPVSGSCTSRCIGC